MSDRENPFANQPEQLTGTTAPPHPAPRLAWTVAIVAVLAALLFLMIWIETNRGQQKKIDSLQAKLAAANADLAQAQSASQTNQDLIANLQTQVADLQKEKELAGQMAKNLESEMRSDLESKDVTISKLQGKLTVTILDRVMFDSGEAVLKPDGAAVMQKIAALLAAHPNLKIHVIGHTDNVPLRPGAKFASNWELSTARALAAVHFLTERAGVDPRRVGAVGYGEFRPIADNSTPEGRAKNRRIAVTILSDEMAGADTPQPASTTTNSPPAAVPPQ
jgi:chemotaxis protein MotB